MNRRVLIGLVLIASALLLNVAFTKYATNRIVTHWDGTVTRTISEGPLLVTSSMISDMICFAGYPCKTRAVAVETGLYPRLTNSISAAIFGLLLPYLLAILGMHLNLQALSGWARPICGATLAVSSLVAGAPVAVLVYRAVTLFHVPVLIAVRDRGATIFAVIVITATLALAEGIVLLARSRKHAVST